MLTIIITLLVISAPFIWVGYKHLRNADKAEKIYREAKVKFENECNRLGICRDNQFSDMYTASFIRCDDTKERIAVYAGQSNRFAVIPYRDFWMILNGANIGMVSTSGNTQYVTNHIGETSVTTKYATPQVYASVTGYRPKIITFCDGETNIDPGYVFDSTGKIGKFRMEKTKMFCEIADSGMGKIRTYADITWKKYKNHTYKKGEPGQSYLEWKKEWDARKRALANKPDPYGSHSI